MLVLGSGIDFQIAQDLAAQRALRQHALDGLLHHPLGMAAVEDLALAIDLEEAELAHHNLLGFCLFKLGRYSEAVASFERAVAIDPSSAIDWANIGVNLERSGEPERAAEFERVMYRVTIAGDRPA